MALSINTNNNLFVIPAQAGIQFSNVSLQAILILLGPRLRGDDGLM